MGPLHSKSAVKEYFEGLEMIKAQGGTVLHGGQYYKGVTNGGENGNYVMPTLIEIGKDAEILKTELFVPICYLTRFKTFEEAI